MTDRLFDIDEVPEVPLIRARRRGKGAQIEDERIDHDYPPEWSRCPTCEATGVSVDPSKFVVERGHASIACSPGQGGNWARVTHPESGVTALCDGSESGIANVSEALRIVQVKLRISGGVWRCPACLGVGSVKARVRLEAGHRCVRCGHPFMPKHDAKMLGVEPSPGHWSPCDERCTHKGIARVAGDNIVERALDRPAGALVADGFTVEAAWRVLTSHHLNGDKADCRWGNVVALCQACHLTVQGRVVMERVYPHPHSEWFKPYVAWHYAVAYLGEDLSREEVMARLDELLSLELDPAYSALS